MLTIIFYIILTAVSLWHYQKTRSQPEKDFIDLNKLGAQNGLTSAHEQSQFCRCNDICRRDKKGEFQNKVVS